MSRTFSLVLVMAFALHSKPTPTLPIYFEPNFGQADSHVQFIARGGRSTLFIGAGGAASVRYPQGNLEMKLSGAADNSAASGIEPMPRVVNYWIGNSSTWRAGVTAYSAVQFGSIYPGIDLVYHGRGGGLEYDFVVAPAADPGAIRLEFSGARKAEISRTGTLLLYLPGGTVEHQKPTAYQMSPNGRHEIPARFVQVDPRRFQFEIPDYDRRFPLIIDPVISLSTFFGAENNEGAFSLALDREGNIYLAGLTASIGLPKTTGTVPAKSYAGATDGFVMKLNPSGTSLIYVTYLGGNDDDTVMAVAVDSTGNAYVTGGTNSRDFPTTPGVLQSTFGGTGGHSFPPFSHPSPDG